VLAVNPEAYLLGEIWDVVPRWVSENHFDGLMNYPLRSAILELLQGKIKAKMFAERVENLLTVYPQEHVYAQFNTLGTHDTERVRTMLGGDVNKVKLAFSFLFAYPGAPSIYYGDEIGLEGDKDPDCRRSFPWDPSDWNQDLFEHIKCLSKLRSQYNALRGGGMKRVAASDSQNCYVFVRSLENEEIIIAINASGSKRSISLPSLSMGWQNGQNFNNLLESGTYTSADDHLILKLNPHSAVWLSLA
jgi:cyclomaltodextrinase / maltogenic alpha-amylase / neopullulanase